MDARLETLYRMQPLSTAETDTLFTEVFAGSMSEPELASLLTALKMKGETLDEIRGAAAAMLRAARPFPKSAFEVGEIVGTGGDGAGTINVSTMTALAAAGAGLRIAKHGNRGVSSPSGASSPSPASAPTPTSSASHARPASSSWAPVLNQADDVSLAVRRLVFGEMTVCGITRADDATRAALEGFSAAGVVLAKRSPRAVTPEGLAVLSNEIKDRTKALGLTMPVTAVVDTDETDVLRAIASPAAAGAFTPLQIHGDVTDADLEGLRVLFPGKALHLAAALPEDPVALAEAARRLEGLLERGLAERIVVDGTSDGLAGGLTPENARTAAAAGAAGLDANSGVESAPGLKDPRLLALFAGAVRGCPRRRPKNRTH